MNPQLDKPLTRDRLSTITLLILVAAGVVGCFIITAPFLPALTWALALAVVAHPLHTWLEQRIGRPDIASGLSVILITVLLLAPFVLLGHHLGKQATEAYEQLESGTKSGDWLAKLQQVPQAAPVIQWAQENVDIQKELQQIGQSLQRRLGGLVSGTIWGLVQFVITLFLLFYLFRDRKQVMITLRSFLPLSENEADDVLEQVRAMTHATVYGTVVVGLIQGALGGLMFWMLGLGMPLLWGAAMGLMSMIPVLGAFTIWAPAVLVLMLQGETGKAALLAAWGLFVVSSIDNILYPTLVGKEIRLHTVPVFIALIGGLAVFGAPGLVLGPVVLAFTLALVEVLRRRTRGNRSAQEPT